jgi:hypothetical protein
MDGLHVYAVLCMLHNPEMCIDYEIVPDNFGPVSSIGYCMKGGAIWGVGHPTIRVGDIDYVYKGVHCKGNPPTNEDIQAWVQAEKERLMRLEPQIK